MMASLAIAIGFAVNALFAGGFERVKLVGEGMPPAGLLKWVCLWILGGLFLFSLLRRGPREVVGSVFSVEALSGAEGGDEEEKHDCCAGGGEPETGKMEEPGGCCGN
jgi:hypothetical protein